MTTLIAGLIISIALLSVIVYFNSKKDSKKKFRANCIVAALPLIIAFFIASIAVIPANSVGVQYSPFKGVLEETLPEGWHFKGVFDNVYIISTEVQTSTLTGITGQTKDSQYVEMVIDVKYKVSPEKAYEVFKQYRTLQNVAVSLVSPTVQRSIEAISTQYNIIEILGEKRNELYTGIEEELTKRFAVNGIQFVSINFTDTDAGAEIEKAIQDEAIAKKRVETAEQERLRVEIEAQQRVIEASANKEKAEIEAQIKLIEAQAEAQANRLIAESITQELLAKMEMEARLKWGWVTVQGGSVITDIREK
ncbi:MAG: SPFH domain / Band 7 family protein [Firmicutes bacterium ADurb.Bin099]|jgi:regulator of protease activity HflC (stomatin/prohibitin superfamily)|nr:MAG: SPFH domain / Band 7 family protein [Firmicutes bacterium ADurb.Bin099]HPY98440.1 prohibitin family protein [Clostridia bacterium]HQC68318.1 prohibitin family protein [Clostridia bacterium]